MFYSEKYNLLVIGIPKTGTASVQNALLKYLDQEGQTHSINIAGKRYVAELFPQGIIGHARAKEFKEVVGESEYNRLITMALLPWHLLEILILNWYQLTISLNQRTSSCSIREGVDG